MLCMFNVALTTGYFPKEKKSKKSNSHFTPHMRAKITKYRTVDHTDSAHTEEPRVPSPSLTRRSLSTQLTSNKSTSHYETRTRILTKFYMMISNKLFNIYLPTRFTCLCSFLFRRTATICRLYVAGLLEPLPCGNYISYAGDITRAISHHSKS